MKFLGANPTVQLFEYKSTSILPSVLYKRFDDSTSIQAFIYTTGIHEKTSSVFHKYTTKSALLKIKKKPIQYSEAT